MTLNNLLSKKVLVKPEESKIIDLSDIFEREVILWKKYF